MKGNSRILTSTQNLTWGLSLVSHVPESWTAGPHRTVVSIYHIHISISLHVSFWHTTACLPARLYLTLPSSLENHQHLLAANPREEAVRFHGLIASHPIHWWKETPTRQGSDPSGRPLRSGPGSRCLAHPRTPTSFWTKKSPMQAKSNHILTYQVYTYI